MKIGDYVNVALVNGKDGEPRQGVYVSDNGDGTTQVQGEPGETYRCFKSGQVVPDCNLFSDTLEFVQAVRRELGL